MACHRISKLFFLPMLLASLSGCKMGEPGFSASLEAKVDRYDLPDITVDMLEADGCMIFEDMYFAKGVEKDHVFRFKGHEITEHVTCPKVKFDAKNFDNVVGESFFETVQKVGIPSFRGLEKDHSVTYLCKDGIERSLCLASEAESAWKITNIISKDFYLELWDYIDQETTYKPSIERCKKIKMGMYINDVFAILGRPCRYSDDNAQVACWGISSGGTIHITRWMEHEGSAFFDPSVFERDDYFQTTEIKENKKMVEVPCYWSVFRLNFNENEPEAFDDHSLSFI